MLTIIGWITVVLLCMVLPVGGPIIGTVAFSAAFNLTVLETIGVFGLLGISQLIGWALLSLNRID